MSLPQGSYNQKSDITETTKGGRLIIEENVFITITVIRCNLYCQSDKGLERQ